MIKFYLVCGLVIIVQNSIAQFSLVSTPYVQNFDNLGLTGGTAAGGDLNLISSGLNGWYFLETGTNANTTFSAGTGTSTTGDTYNFGLGGNNNRTLGGLQSGALIPSYGFWFTNNTGSPIVSLMITYTGETWRVGAVNRPDTLNFQYSTDASSLFSGTWTDFNLLDYGNPGQGTGSGGIQHTSTISNTITGLNILNGTNFFIRWQDYNASGADDGMGINDFSLVATLSSNSITTGTVSAPPFILIHCGDIETGTVDFSSSGTFNAGNIYSAQLSNDIGSFASPTVIGTLSSTLNAGTINITIPAGTPSGAGYKIRVVSSAPSIIGSESTTIQIIQLGFGGCSSSHADYYRSKQTGDWDDVNTWESSLNGSDWINATLAPSYLANTISIQSPDIVTIDASVDVDQVLIFGGATLNHSSGTLTVQDGAGYDIDNNGIFVLLVAGGPSFAGGSPEINTATGAILRVSASGITGAGTGVNANNFVYNNNSVLEYTLTGAFSTSGVTYFPNANAGTIPIFRVTADSPATILVGGSNPTIFNGLFQITGTATVRWRNSGDKIFRNGIQNVGPIDFDAATIDTSLFIINGTTGSLGGSGALDVPNAGLQIGPGTTLTMTSDKTITGNLVLVGANSLVDLGSNDLTVTGTVSNTTVSSYVKTTGAGTLTLNNVDVVGKLYPIGNSTINPLYIQSATTTNYSARVVEPITPPIYNDQQAVLRTWYISSPANSPGATISFGYSFPGDAGPLYSNTGPTSIGVNISGTWNIHQSGLAPSVFPIVPGTYIVTSTIPISYFNGTSTEFPFVIANDGAILSSDYFIVCRSQKQNGNGIINWQVQDIVSVNEFEVQRSVNGGGFQTIGSILPVFNQADYRYVDQLLPAGTSLYRIKVNRSSGGVRYSNTVAILNGAQGLFLSSISPNPVKTNAEIVVSSARATAVNFTVFDLSGRPVKKWFSNILEGTNYIQKDFSDLPGGVYHLLVSAIDSKAVLRFVINK